MAKRFNHQHFYIKFSNGIEEIILCSSARSGDHTSQRASIVCFNNTWESYNGYAQYYNRPWESFDYENAIRALAEKLPKPYKNELREWCKKHAKGEAEEAKKFVSDFKKEWDAARPSLREAVAAGGPIESEEQAKSTLAILKMGNFLNSLG